MPTAMVATAAVCPPATGTVTGSAVETMVLPLMLPAAVWTADAATVLSPVCTVTV